MAKFGLMTIAFRLAADESEKVTVDFMVLDYDQNWVCNYRYWTGN